MLKQSQAIFAVRDVKETIAFYKDVLGFDRSWEWGDPVCYGGANCGDIQVMFNQMPELAKHIEGHQHHFWGEDVNSLYEKHRANGATIVEEIGNRPWGLREYTVRDPNGYHLRFGGPIKFEKPPTAIDSLPEYIEIEQRLPTEEEYVRIVESVKWGKHPESMKCSIVGAVAVDRRNGLTVGMARANEDAHAWYSVWDVAVMPDYQVKRIGTAVVESVLAQLKARGPAGAWVFLFTYSHSFYERLGFRTETCTMRKI